MKEHNKKAYNDYPKVIQQEAGIFTIEAPDLTYVFEGWGTSLCWWAHDLGTWAQEPLDKVMDALFDPVKGLGMNIVRYNIGGGENPAHDHFREGGSIPGFQSIEGQYNENADPYQRRVLQESIKRGVNFIEAFSNSPPYFMTCSQCAGGNLDPRMDNLPSQNFDKFVDYLTEVTKIYRDKWNIDFSTLEPFNEPTTSFWQGFFMNQEGCHFSRDAINAILPKLYRSLQKKGLNTKISGVDETNPTDAYLTLKYLSKEAISVISQYNCHSYNGGYGPRDLLRKASAENGVKLWMSEVGVGSGASLQDIKGGVQLSQIITNDIRNMKPSAWIIWQAVENANYHNNYGLLQANFCSQQYNIPPLIYYTKQYYTMMQYTQFIRPGAKILDSDDPRTVVTLDLGGRGLTIVISSCEDVDTYASYDLKEFTMNSQSSTKVYRTSSYLNCELINQQLSNLRIERQLLHISVPQQSITTIRISNIEILKSKL